MQFNENEYKKQFNKSNYDSILVYLPKGKKDILKETAKQQGISTNALINAAINEFLHKNEKSM